MQSNDVFMGKTLESWESGNAFTVTLSVTEACNLACTYCYMVHKNNQKRMSYETATQIINYLMADEAICQNEAIILDFIGGEPLLEIELIDKICDYFLVKAYKEKHKWLKKYRFSFSTNGILYDDPKFQKYLNKHRGHISVGISLDGNERKHNLSRVKKDGSGSYHDVVRNVPLWQDQFSDFSTKATFSHDDLLYLKDSIIHLWNNLKINNVMANIVYEDVWKDGDEKIYEEQLMGLSDYILETKCWDEFSVRFLDPNVGNPIGKQYLINNVCGAGKGTIAFDTEGNIYPCIRFLDFCSDGKQRKIIGTMTEGINQNRVRSLQIVNVETIFDDECKNCDVATGCNFCIGHNYSITKMNTIFERPKYICKMHKVNAKVNSHFWYQYSKINNCTSPKAYKKLIANSNDYLNYLYIITNDDITPHCGYENKLHTNNKMSQELLRKGIDYCQKRHLIPIFLGKNESDLDVSKSMFFEIIKDENNQATSIINSNISSGNKPVIKNVVNKKENLSEIAKKAEDLLQDCTRLNLFVSDLWDWEEEDFIIYQSEIDKLTDMLINKMKNNDQFSLNIINDFWNKKNMKNCGAGKTSITLAPDGNFYICPAFYFDHELQKHSLGSIDVDYTFEKIRLLEENYRVFCKGCENHACSFCLYDNFKSTSEIHLPGVNQCRYNNINNEGSQKIKTSVI